MPQLLAEGKGVRGLGRCIFDPDAGGLAMPRKAEPAPSRQCPQGQTDRPAIALVDLFEPCGQQDGLKCRTNRR
jgi:hypothetical protein